MEKPQTTQEIAAALRLALRGLVRPVAVLTAEHRGVRHAMAATAFCEVSMDPPSMLVCINRSNATYTAVAEGTEIGLSLLSEEQEEVSRRCGGGAAGEDKFAVGEWLLEAGKPPRLADGCAAMVLRIAQCVDHGTHDVVIGEIVDIAHGAAPAPLAFHDGAYFFPLTQAALNLVAQSRKTGEADGMNDGYLMMDLMRAFYWFDEGLQSALKARGWQSISRSQSFTLANIALGIHRPSDIARNLGISRQAVSKMLQEMGEQGLITVEPDPDDKRASLVGFSEKSAQLRADALEILMQLERTIGERIGARALKALRAALGQDWGALPA
ncbi:MULTISPECIES: flavin reductase [Sphingopyxis]|uniref:flavin reductase n=1 Tax=Sphingopyxis TaxID=165697 RepID=UPI0009FACEFE|nr:MULTISPECIES: flavin reductase [Sphingopyxis]AVA15432.1 hypothetical protein C3E99_17620 [Sphingopyxis sp. MG]